MTDTPLVATDVISLVDRLLSDAVARRASDMHIEPLATGGEVRFRIDGLLQTVERCDTATARGIVNRSMVLAKLLTYRLDLPQEGRASVRLPGIPRPVDLRISIMPTTHGLRCAIRLPAELIQPQTLEDLGLPQGVLAGLVQFARSDAGMLIVTGPAGSGKTTTVYALLRHLATPLPRIEHHRFGGSGRT